VVGEPDNAPDGRAAGWSPPAAREWAAPEAPALDPTEAVGAAPMPAPQRVRTEPRAVDAAHGRPQVPVRLHPLTVGDILDGAWSVITCRPQAVFGACALVLVPTAILGSLLVRTFGDSLSVWTALRVFFPYIHPGTRSSPGWIGAALAVALLSLATFVFGVAISRMVMSWYDGRELSAVRAVLEALRRFPAILGAYLVLLVPKGIAVAAFLAPAWLVFPFLLFVAPVIAIEDAGPLRAIRRSASLVGRRYFRVLAIWTLWLLVEQIVTVALGLLVDFVAQFAPDDVDRILRPAGWALVAFVTMPASAGMAVVLYLDLRVRSEGMDLERDVAEAFAGG